MLPTRSVYDCKHARFDGTARALTDEELFKAAPSIFAKEAHESRSERFAPIATIQVLDGLRREGFMPVAARQCRIRDESKREYCKHLIRLRQLGDINQVGDTVCEILLKNANDGSCQYNLMAGLWRVLCQNSLVAKTGTIDEVKVRHSGDLHAVTGKVIEGTYRVLGEARTALAAAEEWSKINVPEPAKQAFGEAARVIRFGDADGNVDTPIQAKHLLNPRRPEDFAGDLWTTFNRVQENCLKGGLSAWKDDPNTQRGRRRVTTREVKGIDQDIRLNKALWVLADTLAKSLH